MPRIEIHCSRNEKETQKSSEEDDHARFPDDKNSQNSKLENFVNTDAESLVGFRSRCHQCTNLQGCIQNQLQVSLDQGRVENTKKS